VARSKYAEIEGFSQTPDTAITLQDLFDEVRFRSIEIREFEQENVALLWVRTLRVERATPRVIMRPGPTQNPATGPSLQLGSMRE